MWFSIGVMEVALVGTFALVTLALAFIRQPTWKWGLVASICAIVATVSTPADLASTLLLSILFFAFFLGGSRFGKRQTIAVA
jgi:hypothetical protein